MLAALREVYDGRYARHVATDGGKAMTWEGKVGLIFASTEAFDTHHSVISAMGDRYLLCASPPLRASSSVLLSTLARRPSECVKSCRRSSRDCLPCDAPNRGRSASKNRAGQPHLFGSSAFASRRPPPQIHDRD